MKMVTLIVKELNMVSSRVVILTWRISRESCSSAEIIFTAWPGIGGETVFKTTFGPVNFTSTSAMADFEFATRSLLLLLLLLLSMEEFVVEHELQGDGSNELLLLLLAILVVQELLEEIL